MFTQAISLDVIDPLNRTGKITIPTQHIQETRGLIEARTATASAAKDYSLCLLFQQGRCNAGTRCHQIHAEPTFVAKLRAQASAGSACCALHGDFNSQGFLSCHQTITIFDQVRNESRTYAVGSCARTSALESLLRSHTGMSLRTTAAKVCRLHLQSKCKFGRDCKNIHLCANAKTVQAAPVIPVVPTPAKEIGISFRNLESTASSCGLSQLSSPKKRSPSSVRSVEEASLSVSTASQESSPDRTVRPLSALALTEPAWSKPLAMPKMSPNFESNGFESTLSLVCEDLSMLHVSPSFFAMSPSSQFASF